MILRIVFLETSTLGEDVDLSSFDQLGDVVRYTRSDPEQYAERIKDAQVLIVNKIPVNADTLRLAENLKLVCITATGTNNVDFTYTNNHGIKVCNVKGYSTASVIQHTFAILFYLYEKLSYYDRYVKSGDYARSNIFSHFTNPFHELTGKTWGIIGLGEIGRGVADIARNFGCRTIYYSTSGKNMNSDYTQVDLDTLLCTSDIISIHAPLTDRTKELIGEKQLRSMKQEAILLNLGRGPIINEEALVKALKEDWIGAAGLDVLSVEPMRKDSPLLEIQDSSKLIITPHIAWATIEARERVVEQVFQNITAFNYGDERNIVRQ